MRSGERQQRAVLAEVEYCVHASSLVISHYYGTMLLETLVDIFDDKILYRALAVTGTAIALIISAAVTVKIGPTDGLFCIWMIAAFYLSFYFIACWFENAENAKVRNALEALISVNVFRYIPPFIIVATVGAAAAIWHFGVYLLSKS